YAGGDTVNLAMERGEIQGRTNQWASWKVLRPEWIKSRQLSYLLQYGPREPELAFENVPTLGDLVKDPQDKAIVNILEIAQYVGRGIFAPPDLPAERLSVLRNAFDRTMQDGDFISRMKALNLDLNPRNASEVQAELIRAMTNRDAVVRDMK